MNTEGAIIYNSIILYGIDMELDTSNDFSNNFSDAIIKLLSDLIPHDPTLKIYNNNMTILDMIRTNVDIPYQSWMCDDYKERNDELIKVIRQRGKVDEDYPMWAIKLIEHFSK